MKWQVQVKTPVDIQKREVMGDWEELPLEVREAPGFPQNVQIVDEYLSEAEPLGNGKYQVELYLTLEVDASFPEMALSRAREHVLLVSEHTGIQYVPGTYEMLYKTQT
jgi:hypothetical protein